MSVGNKHPHYHKDVSGLQTVDVYRVLALFNVTDPCIQHAVKKLLVAGGRGAGKDIGKDIQEAIDSLERFKEMRVEDTEPAVQKIEPAAQSADSRDAERYRKLAALVSSGDWSVARTLIVDRLGATDNEYMDDKADMDKHIDAERTALAQQAGKEQP
jgi:hypothetical protein